MPASPTPAPTARALLPRQELFAYHAARGASLAQASRLAGYSPQGARQRGSVLMANRDIRLRVEEFRRDWMAERDATIGEAVEETGQVIETALRLDRPTAALKAIELKLKLRGVIHDRRFSLYTDSPDDDLSTVAPAPTGPLTSMERPCPPCQRSITVAVRSPNGPVMRQMNVDGSQPGRDDRQPNSPSRRGIGADTVAHGTRGAGLPSDAQLTGPASLNRPP